MFEPFAEAHVVLSLLRCNRLLKHELFQKLCSPRLDIAVGIFEKTFDYSQFLPIGNATEQLDRGPPRFDGPLTCVDLQTAADRYGWPQDPQHAAGEIQTPSVVYIVIDGAPQGIRAKDLGDGFSSNAIPTGLTVVIERPATPASPSQSIGSVPIPPSLVMLLCVSAPLRRKPHSHPKSITNVYFLPGSLSTEIRPL